MSGDFSFKDSDNEEEEDSGDGALEDAYGNAVEDPEEEDDEPVLTGNADNYEIHDNVARDLVKFSRSRIAKNEAQFMLVAFGYMTGRMEDTSHYLAGVITGTSSSGKSKLQGHIEELFPDDWLYTATSGSDQSIVYDDTWDDASTASLNEINKLSDTLVEILKGLHGDDEELERKVTDVAEDDVKTLRRKAKPYWALYAQQQMDFELANRLLNVPVHESKEKNNAVVDIQWDHSNVSFAEDGNDTEYIFDFQDGHAALREHVEGIPSNVRVKLPAGEDEFDWDAIEHARPIFDMQRSEVNRVSAMVANLVRGSCVWNYHNREKRTVDVPNEGEKDVLVAEPQDLANVLRCRDILTSTTHQLTRKGRAICEVLREYGGSEQRLTIRDIVKYLRRSGAVVTKREEVERTLEGLRENYLVIKLDGASASGKDMFEFVGWHQLGEININDEFKRLFKDIEEPIDGNDFIEYTRKQNKAIQLKAGDYVDRGNNRDETSEAGSSDSNGTAGQSTLGGGGDTGPELELHEEVVRDAVADAVGGDELEGYGTDEEPTVYDMVGLEEEGGFDDTLLDPDADCWNHMGVPKGWVESVEDARSAVDETIRELHSKGVMETEIVEARDGEPYTIVFHVSTDI